MSCAAIRQELRTSTEIPFEALRAAVAHADALAPEIYALADKFRRGVWLLIEDNQFLFYGLHVLAAARHPDLRVCVLSLLRHHDGDLENLFAMNATTVLGELYLTSWSGDVAEPFHLLEHADLMEDGIFALFAALARLTVDGRVPRQHTADFLERYESQPLAVEHDAAWLGWAEAVVGLGLVALEPALQRVWRKPACAVMRDIDREADLAEMRATAGDPTGATRRYALEIGPIADVADAFGWLSRRQEQVRKWEAEQASKQDTVSREHDPAAAVRPDAEELAWLAGLLDSAQMPDETMPFEMVDGFMTALVIGPVAVPPSEYLPMIWGTDSGKSPAWDSVGQADATIGLLTRHWNTLAALRMAGAPFEPWLGPRFGDAALGSLWADGFDIGIGMRDGAWEPIFEHPRHAAAVFTILDLARRESEADADNPVLRPKQRAQVLEMLPELVRRIAEFWKDPAAAMKPLQPVRSAKVGRNEACPCGSGKKFKKCCGAANTVH